MAKIQIEYPDLTNLTLETEVVDGVEVTRVMDADGEFTGIFIDGPVAYIEEGEDNGNEAVQVSVDGAASESVEAPAPTA